MKHCAKFEIMGCCLLQVLWFFRSEKVFVLGSVLMCVLWIEVVFVLRSEVLLCWVFVAEKSLLDSRNCVWFSSCLSRTPSRRRRFSWAQGDSCRVPSLHAFRVCLGFYWQCSPSESPSWILIEFLQKCSACAISCCVSSCFASVLSAVRLAKLRLFSQHRFVSQSGISVLS